jgi:hypothetical protein
MHHKWRVNVARSGNFHLGSRKIGAGVLGIESMR